MLKAKCNKQMAHPQIVVLIVFSLTFETDGCCSCASSVSVLIVHDEERIYIWGGHMIAIFDSILDSYFDLPFPEVIAAIYESACQYGLVIVGVCSDYFQLIPCR